MVSIWNENILRLVPALLIALVILLGSAVLRGSEYDEGYSIFVAAGSPRPAWPSTPFTPSETRHFFTGHSTISGIAHDMRTTDVHPPLYFWSEAAWRGLVGTGLFRTRLVSVLFSMAALCVVAAIARLMALPPVLAVLLTIGCYGFAYTGSIARGFALAHLLLLGGVLLVLLAWQRGRAELALAGGLLLGAATFTNYLTAFVGAAALLWLLLFAWRRPMLWIAAGIGFALFLPLDFWFFVAQRGSRNGQFPPFHLLPSLVRITQYSVANVLGGLPLYVSGAARLVVGAMLVLGLAALVALVVARWRRIARPAERTLLAFAIVATPVGLILLGFAFDNTPIELRYIAFATPFFALMVAGAAASLAPRAGLAVCVALLAVQSLSITGMVASPETMQPQRETARAAARLAAPDALVLVPYGNDGVGVLGAFVDEAPAGMHILDVPNGQTSRLLQARITGHARVVLALLALDGDSKATVPAMEQSFATDPCWRRDGAGFNTVSYARICR